MGIKDNRFSSSDIQIINRLVEEIIIIVDVRKVVYIISFLKFGIFIARSWRDSLV